MTVMGVPSRRNGKTDEKTGIDINEFCDRVTEASYLVASECGFRGSYLAFLSDFHKALEQVAREMSRK